MNELFEMFLGVFGRKVASHYVKEKNREGAIDVEAIASVEPVKDGPDQTLTRLDYTPPRFTVSRKEYREPAQLKKAIQWAKVTRERMGLE